jgi:hypothetical protein
MINRTVAEARTLFVDGWEIVTIESIVCAVIDTSEGLMATALREPIAIIVRYPEGDRAYSLEGREMPVPENGLART